MIPKSARQFIDLRSRKYETLNTIELDQKNLLSNLNHFRQNKDIGVIPVLKANAYGHGLSRIAEMLDTAHCEMLAVDGYFEANAIKDITKHRVLVLGYINPANVRLLNTKKCSFVVQDEAGLEALGRLGKSVKIHIELNTGMNRLGLSDDELISYLETLKKFPKLQLEGVMTHLADADNETTDAFTEAQARQFDQMVEIIKAAGFKPKYLHVAQTAGSMKFKSKYANCMRLGIGLYGINPLNPLDKQYKNLEELRPVLKLKSTVIKVIELQKGDKVSYNGIFTAPSNMRIGVLPLGYYEGVPRELSNKGLVTCNGSNLPIVGRVCMNHTMVDLGDNKIQVGQEVVVIDNRSSAPNSVENICEAQGLFNYELLTKLSSSTRRIIV